MIHRFLSVADGNRALCVIHRLEGLDTAVRS